MGATDKHLEELKKLAASKRKKFKPEVNVNLERHMKCGLGKCGYCQIENIYCCQDGPVFYFDKIKHIKGAI